MRRPSRKIRFLFLALLLALAGVWLLALPDDSQPEWRTEKVTRGDIAVVLSASGKLNPKRLVTVGTQVSGQISRVHVNVNEYVAKGQLMAEIDPSLLEAELRQSTASMETARVNYEQAQRNLKRMRILVEKNYVAQVNLEEAQAASLQAKNNYEAARSQVERSKVNLGYARILSPIDGLVVSREIEEGQTMASSFQTPTLFTIAGDMSAMKIEIEFSESEIALLKVGMPVTFGVDAFPDREFTGKIETVNLYMAKDKSGYTAVVEADNGDKVLFPGMTAYVSIALSDKKDVLRVPVAALRFKPPAEADSSLKLMLNRLSGVPRRRTVSSANIHVLRGGNLVPLEITLGVSNEMHAEVTGGDIAEGDEAITGVIAPAQE